MSECSLSIICLTVLLSLVVIGDFIENIYKIKNKKE
jgi:hypothetical protein